MMRPEHRLLPLWLVLVSLPVLAASDNPDEFSRKTLQLPNKETAVIVTYGERPWREVDPVILAGEDTSDPDVCFEARFDSFVPPNHIKLLGLEGTVVVDDPVRQKLADGLKRNESVWLCGTLRKARGAKNVEFYAVELIKLPPDLERYTRRIAVLEKARDADALIELGYRIEQRVSQNIGFDEYDKLHRAEANAFKLGLQIKEELLKPDDVDGLFALALQWRELLRKNDEFRRLVRKCLEIDPDHPKASRIATDELGLVKFENSWKRPEEAAAIQAQRQADQARHDAAVRAEQEARERERQQAIAERPSRLRIHEMALRDPRGREAALDELAKAAEQTIDPGFAEEAIEILDNSPDEAAVSPGLERVGHSGFPQVRQHVFEALVWRLRQGSAKAATVLRALLQAEREPKTARVAVESLESLGERPAVPLLIDALLQNPDRTVRDEITEGLRAVTGANLPSKEAWEDWWNTNKEKYATP